MIVLGLIRIKIEFRPDENFKIMKLLLQKRLIIELSALRKTSRVFNQFMVLKAFGLRYGIKWRSSFLSKRMFLLNGNG